MALLDEEVNCDVRFLVGHERKETRAHRFCLAEVSPVFQAIFFGPMKNQGNVVQELDITLEIF